MADKKFLSMTIQTDDLEDHPVEIRYKQDGEAGIPSFYIKSKTPNFTVEDSDVKQLLEKAKAMFTSMNAVSWEPMLLVSVLATMTGVALRLKVSMTMTEMSGMVIGYTSYEQGVSINGDKLWRTLSQGRWGRKDDQGRVWNIHAGTPYTWDEDLTVEQANNQYGITIMKDTLENRTKLQALMQAMEAARTRMAKFANDGVLDVNMNTVATFFRKIRDFE